MCTRAVDLGQEADERVRDAGGDDRPAASRAGDDLVRQIEDVAEGAALMQEQHARDVLSIAEVAGVGRL